MRPILLCTLVLAAAPYCSQDLQAEAPGKTEQVSVFGLGQMTVPADFPRATKQSGILSHEFQATAGEGKEAATARSLAKGYPAAVSITDGNAPGATTTVPVTVSVSLCKRLVRRKCYSANGRQQNCKFFHQSFLESQFTLIENSLSLRTISVPRARSCLESASVMPLAEKWTFGNLKRASLTDTPVEPD